MKLASLRAGAAALLMGLSLLLVPPAWGGEVEPRPAPEITAGAWLNSAPLTLEKLHGRVVLVEFWTYACWNCRNVEPHIKAWHQKYQKEGLTVVGVHTPELDHERVPENVKKYVKKNEIPYPVALDNDYAIWRRYGNRYWPALYLVDKQGNIRYQHFGEGHYAETEAAIQKLLAEETDRKDTEGAEKEES